MFGEAARGPACAWHGVGFREDISPEDRREGESGGDYRNGFW
ncbi:hypothetical protein AK972_3464 [Pseudomonas yamanorum]|nr:hypothetical protein AK972_3464 [Pseudomonas yamanorum]